MEVLKMHEVGMLYNLAKAVTEVAEKNNIDRIRSIDVEVGELTAVIPKVFEDYYPIVAEDYPILKDSVVNLKMIPGEAMCRDCHSLYKIVPNEGECPKCHSSFKKILSGMDVRLVNFSY